MRAEAWIFGGLAIFFVPVTPIYYLMSGDPTGTVALIMTFLLTLMIAGYFGLVARRITRGRRTGRRARSPRGRVSSGSSRRRASGRCSSR